MPTTMVGVPSESSPRVSPEVAVPNTVPPSASSVGRFSLAVLCAAIGAASFAIVFRWALAGAVHLLYSANDLVEGIRGLAPWQRVLSTALGGLAAGSCALAVRAVGTSQGVSDVMEAVVLGRVRLSLRVTLLKSLASYCAIVGGGSLGREGPLIQFGGAIAQWVAARLRLTSSQTRRLIAAGVAAGFAAAYNTPFAAVLFMIEVVTGVIVLDAILPALVATCVATALTRASAGPGAIYGERAFTLQTPTELLAFAGLGVLAGLAAQMFMRMLSLGEHACRRSGVGLPWRAMLGGCLAGACAMVVPEVAGNGYEPLNLLLDGRFTLPFLGLLLVGKAVATTASVSSGSPGGVFTPSLLIGGCVGFMYQNLLGQVLWLGPPGGYALVGMAAATAATTHAPLMAAVMAFELSGDYAIALPLVLATAIATLVSRALRRDSIYSAELKQRGIAWELTLEGRRVER